MEIFNFTPVPISPDGAWHSPLYRETVLIVLGVLLVSGLIVFLLRNTSFYFRASWASIKSWLLLAPISFTLFGLPDPIPLITLTAVAILGAKVFFQIMGMFHRSYFVLICYAGILLLSVYISMQRIEYYNLMPMIVLGASCLVPIVRNSYKNMIQYISITVLGFVFLGWSFMHLGLIMQMPSGLYQTMYLIILTEFCDNTNLALGRYFTTQRIFSRINRYRSLTGTATAIVATLGLAFIMRYLLPDPSQRYWLAAGVVASVGGLFGDLVMTVVRRDAGIRVVQGFILGRGDFLARMDRLVFVAPIYFYVMRIMG